MGNGSSHSPESKAKGKNNDFAKVVEKAYKPARKKGPSRRRRKNRLRNRYARGKEEGGQVRTFGRGSAETEGTTVRTGKGRNRKVGEGGLLVARGVKECAYDRKRVREWKTKEKDSRRIAPMKGGEIVGRYTKRNGCPNPKRKNGS